MNECGLPRRQPCRTWCLLGEPESATSFIQVSGGLRDDSRRGHVSTLSRSPASNAEVCGLAPPFGGRRIPDLLALLLHGGGFCVLAFLVGDILCSLILRRRYWRRGC